VDFIRDTEHAEEEDHVVAGRYGRGYRLGAVGSLWGDSFIGESGGNERLS
jgi:hypothetical protein